MKPNRHGFFQADATAAREGLAIFKLSRTQAKTHGARKRRCKPAKRTK